MRSEPMFLLNIFFLNPLSANFTKWSNTLKQFVGKLPTNCLSVFDHFGGLARKGLKLIKNKRAKQNSKLTKSLSAFSLSVTKEM